MAVKGHGQKTIYVGNMHFSSGHACICNLCTVRSEKYACTKFPVRSTNFSKTIRMTYKFLYKIPYSALGSASGLL